MKKNREISSTFRCPLEEFEEETREDISQLWADMENADIAHHVQCTDTELAKAYKNVKVEIASEESTASQFSFITYAAAAVFLMVATGIAYLLMPVKVQVPAGETKTIQMSDNSTIHLNSGSVLSYSHLFNWWSRNVRLKGEAFFEIKSSEHPFRVVTGNASVEVLGTKFNVRYWPNEKDNMTSVFLSEGKVLLQATGTNNSVTLHPGKQSWISNNHPSPVAPRPVDPTKALAWQQDSFAFENQHLSSIFKEIQRRFDVKINYHPNISNDKITIYLSDIETAEMAIKDICRAKGLIYKKKNDSFLIYRN
ncbi:FecR family protein [Fodinibius halophilus]|uniref:DUF4974 domain-containing protein n=1 Tax=Fodinibius halophilus TaxID=1736908 RepID=A0A6M1T2Q1_9BACT|nr:FecR family protein [Fodinibius halophilus]NGP86893.1 DUF4974 domain-containing protein [Fodinibius halophilus]